MHYGPLLKNGTPRTSVMHAAALFLLIFAHPASDDPSNRDSFYVHLLKGDEYYHSFNNTQALAEYEQAFEMAPDSFAVLERLVSIYNDMGRLRLHKDTSSLAFYRMSLAYADSLERHFPERAESHFWLALCQGSLIPFLSSKEKIHTARSVLMEANKTIEIDSGFAQAYVILGIFQREASRMSWLERVIANIVFGADISGSLTASEILLRKSVTLSPSNSYAYFELYWTYRAMKDSVHAKESLRRLLTIPPKNSREQQQAEEARRQLAHYAGKQ